MHSFTNSLRGASVYAPRNPKFEVLTGNVMLVSKQGSGETRLWDASSKSPSRGAS